MEKAMGIRNSRGSAALKMEKTAYLLLGIITYIVGVLRVRLSSSDNCAAFIYDRRTASKDKKDKETALADFCAVSVAFTVASVVYVTMLFCVGKGYSNGIGAEILVSGGIFAVVYSVIRFLTTIK